MELKKITKKNQGYTGEPIVFNSEQEKLESESYEAETMADLRRKDEEDLELVRELQGTYTISDYERNAKQIRHNIAHRLINKLSTKTVGEKIKEIYVYQDGIYVRGEEILAKLVRAVLGESCTKNAKNEIMDAIQDVTHTDRQFFDSQPNLIVVENGILNIQSRTITPHTSEHLSFRKLPITFDPEAKCPAIEKFISEVALNEDVKVLQEWAGFCLLKDYRFKKALFLIGLGDNGKTVWMNLLKHFIGGEASSNVSLQDLTGDTFAPAELYGKYLNAFDDLEYADIKSNSAFKMATGSSELRAQRKFKEPFKFTSYAKLTFTANQVPSIKKADDSAFFNRWILIKFFKQFIGDKADPRLLEKLITKAEMSGYLNYALVGLDRLLKQGGFSYALSEDDVRIEMTRSANSVAAFAYDCLEEDSEALIPITKESMYQDYRGYCIDNGLEVSVKNMFGKELPQFLPLADGSKRSRIDPDKKDAVEVWRNLKFKGGAVDDTPLPEPSRTEP